VAAAESEALKVESAAPNIVLVHAADNRSVVVSWKSGGESVIDLSSHIARFVIFKPLVTDDELFAKVTIGDWGWSIGWSEDMEISSDTLWRLALEQGAAWLHSWRRAHRLTQAAAARALGIGPRMWRYYEAGSHLLPKTVRLAAIGLDALSRAA
jgi:hypothetical protein